MNNRDSSYPLAWYKEKTLLIGRAWKSEINEPLSVTVKAGHFCDKRGRLKRPVRSPAWILASVGFFLFFSFLSLFILFAPTQIWKKKKKKEVKVKGKNRSISENTYFNFQANKGSPCGGKEKKLIKYELYPRFWPLQLSLPAFS